MAEVGDLGCVAVVVRVEAPGPVELQQPPPGYPSAHWMEKLLRLLQPLGQSGGSCKAFGCCLVGTLEEVFNHLWQHQVLFMSLCLQGRESHVAVQFSELLEAGQDLSGGHYANEVHLEDEGSLPGSSGPVAVSIELIATAHASKEVISDPVVSELLQSKPSSIRIFTLHLELAAESLAMLAQTESSGDGRTPHKGPLNFGLRFGGVEKPLPLPRSGDASSSLGTTLVLADSWGELPEALSELGVFLQVSTARASSGMTHADIREVPVDMSSLAAAAASPEGGPEYVAAEVRSGEVASLGQGLAFIATLRALRWRGAASDGQVLPGRSKDADVWAEGLRLTAAGVRRWRLSVEIRSVRLSARTAKVFVTYAYAPFQQPRPFRSNPPILARRKATVNIPHNFAAYKLTASFDDLQAQLAEPLRAEVWHRDVYRKDSMLGFAEAAVGPVFEQRLQHSESLPDMAEGFRVLDQVCPILSSEDAEPKQAGVLRLLFFLEDLGPAPQSGRARLATVAAEAPQDLGPAPQPSKARPATAAAEAPQASAVPVTPLPFAAPPGAAQGAAEAGGLFEAGVCRESAGAGGNLLPPQLPTSSTYELKLWQRAEESKFHAYLAQQEADLKDRLEAEYQTREEARAAEFAQRRTGLQEVEAQVRRKLQELQQREVGLVAEEARVSALKDEVKRRTELAVKEHEDASRRITADAAHGLSLARERSHFLEEQVAHLEAELDAVRRRLRELEGAHEERQRQIEASKAPPVQLKQELQQLRMQLREQQLSAEALAASRDHFKSKVQDLCGRLLGSHPAVPALSASAECAAPTGGSLGVLDADRASTAVAEALRKVQEDLAQLAQTWEAADATPRKVRFESADVSSDAKELQQQERHLAWLRSQRAELLETGLYGSGDMVLLALDAKIAEAEKQLL
eukprot:TRINITY_DN25803_c0_g1_i2.p1 TRINITY_DN25803_c0_g1~~TRINITY_DN25803_c0_g1_i2.p1  ORF type:complete len:917 (-),score=270.24 TRINITY_DN25803_c0_g1_i2:38-2788(-)